MGKERRILIYFDELVMSLTKAYGSTMDTHIYSPRDILSSMQGIRQVDAVEVVHGYWIERPLDNFRKYEVKCSECGFVGIGNYDQYLEPYDFNYCPNCGADMRERKDDA